MIVDHIKNIRRYPQFEEYAEAIMEFIEKCRREFLPAGRYDLLADNRLYALMQYYETKPKEEGRMESHRAYADLQFVLSGRETIFYDLAEELTIAEDQSREKDIIFYEGRPDKGGIVLAAGMFACYEPQDAHMPCIRCGEDTEKVEKIVFKILTG